MKTDRKNDFFCKLVTTVATLAMMAFIFGNSLQSGEESGARSIWWLELINDNLKNCLGITVTEFFVRKLAHFGEFALLGLLLFCFWRAWRQLSPRCLFLWALGSGFLVACTDEFLQLFSEGRAARLMDVGIDTLGCLCGALVMCGLVCLARRKTKIEMTGRKVQ